jgi:hypothetical protein
VRPAVGRGAPRYDSAPVSGQVGGARDDWKPDFSDPFLYDDAG